MAKSSGADPDVLVELATAIPIRQLAARADLPTTLREAATAYIDLQGHAATLADALADVERPCVTTSLLAVEASLGLADGWIPLAHRLTTAGGLTPDDAQRLRAVRLAPPAGGERSAYRGAGPLGVAVRASFSRQGAIVNVQVALGGVASYPLQAPQVEATLRGRRASQELIAVAAETALQEARPAGLGSLTAEEDLALVRSVTLEALQATLL